jgi:Mn-dependent DtxR family transcriptional regulator
MDLNVLADELLELLRQSPTGSLSFAEGASRLGVSELTIADAARRLEDRDLVTVAMGVVYLPRGKMAP